MSREFPIGVFDSGLGGITVLRALKRHLPHEDFIYLADRENAPYGSKNDGEIIRLVNNAVTRLLNYNCKAIVLACNTATSVAAEILRNKYEVQIIGLEPAIKPAVAKYPSGNILVLATPVTLEHRKFINLLASLGEHNVISVAAPRLVYFVENGLTEASECIDYLSALLSPYSDVRFDACVLGCTHFPFARNSITTTLGYTPDFFDGAEGAAGRLEYLLCTLGIASDSLGNGSVIWLNSASSNQQRSLLYSKYNHI